MDILRAVKWCIIGGVLLLFSKPTMELAESNVQAAGIFALIVIGILVLSFAGET